MSRKVLSNPRSEGGFTLVEVAVVVAIIGLLLGALLVPLATQVQAARRNETERKLDEVKEALVGYALTNGRLPCPEAVEDITVTPLELDGLEDRTPANPVPCNSLDGILPWQTLGVSPTDAWGRAFFYSVSADFTVQRTAGDACALNDGQLGLCDVGDLRVMTRGDDTTTGPAESKAQIMMTIQAPAVIISLGANGYGGTDLIGNTIAPPPLLGADEANNFDFFPNVPAAQATPPGNPRVFVTRSFINAENTDCDDVNEGVPACVFDDQLIWLSASVLFNRMVLAGQLP